MATFMTAAAGPADPDTLSTHTDAADELEDDGVSLPAMMDTHCACGQTQTQYLHVMNIYR
eukprot:21912-Eustigmatos_ZCMA.PRE.1